MLEQAMEISQLKGEISSMRYRVSAAINLLEQVRIALEEDDEPEEALRLVKEALGRD